MDTTKEDKKMRPHWYKIYITECPICGSYEETRVRQYDDPPQDKAERYSYTQYACSWHWLVGA